MGGGGKQTTTVCRRSSIRQDRRLTWMRIDNGSECKYMCCRLREHGMQVQRGKIDVQTRDFVQRSSLMEFGFSAIAWSIASELEENFATKRHLCIIFMLFPFLLSQPFQSLHTFCLQMHLITSSQQSVQGTVAFIISSNAFA